MPSIARLLVPLLLVVIAACGPSGPTTPPDGSAEREAIFAAIRQGREIQDQVFVPTHFKVQDNWAWVTADPQSKDGANHYEPKSWLLQKTANDWRVLAQPCQEADCVWADEVAKIRAKFPQAPEAIFPK
jgi:predicted small lipoprotein YifL